MRYTTLIDISESKDLYRNPNVRLVYLHLVLKSGYHDNDRDICTTSIRNLAAATGLTIAATRHALKQLTKAKLVERINTAYKVKKWVQADKPMPRPSGPRKGKADAAQAAREHEEQAINRERERQQRQQLRQRGKTEFMLYFESLQKRAANGDLDAQIQVQKRQAMYDEQVAKLKNNDKQ